MPEPARSPSDHDAIWRKIDSFLDKGTLIPILGRGAITFGDDDQPLYPWLIRQIVERHCIPGTPRSLHDLVCEHLKANRDTIEEAIEDICLDLDELLGPKKAPAPGRLLRTLASLSQCRAFFTLGCDSLLEGALREVRGYAREPWVFATDRAAVDLPSLDGAGTTLGYLFGKASANPGFQLWDADTVEFVWRLQLQMPTLNTLGTTLANNNLLIIGADMSDWALRFLLRVIRQRPLAEGASKNFFLADAEPPQDEQTIIFYDSLKKGITVLRTDPIDFARQFCARALALAPALTAGTGAHIPLMEPVAADGSVFVSYAHSDHEAAFEIVRRLQAEGCKVWLDTERLTCGDDFENHLEQAVMKKCGFFLSAISRSTETRSEAYFHKERNWAARRCASMPSHVRPFYFPVVIDDTPLPPQHEPPAFASIDAERAPGGTISDVFAQKLAEYQRRLLTPA